jgi:2-haloacid dehalogenase
MTTKIKALTFDVFGTSVDWRGSLIRQGKAFAREKRIELNWEAFADAWRAAYEPSMDRVRTGELPWMNLDALQRQSLESLLPGFGVSCLSDFEKDRLVRFWHRLDPWPDTVDGLIRLRRHYILATLSNGNVALLVNMAKFANLPWDCVLSAELAQHYKRDREVYEMAVALLGLRPDEVMMVAAHKNDLKAAASVGLKTAFVRRPLELGPQGHPDLAPDEAFDINAEDFNDLARKLGA